MMSILINKTQTCKIIWKADVDIIVLLNGLGDLREFIFAYVECFQLIFLTLLILHHLKEGLFMLVIICLCFKINKKKKKSGR